MILYALSSLPERPIRVLRRIPAEDSDLHLRRSFWLKETLQSAGIYFADRKYHITDLGGLQEVFYERGKHILPYRTGFAKMRF